MSTGTAGGVGDVDRTAETKRKTVEFVSKQTDDQLVTGVVMSPYEVDRQGDYETPETIAQFAADFGDMYANGSADGGIMHAAWPSEWMDLTHNGIVGKTFPDDAPIPDDIETMEGCIEWAEENTDVDDPAAFCQSYNVADDIDDDVWAQTWRVTDDDLWSLIDDEIIQGFSIGARDVTWSDPIEQADLPENVGVPDDYPDDAPVYELQDGVVREVSAVDTPAVPSAQILAKDDKEAALDEYLGDREGFIDEMLQRGHSESEAERVWNVMSRAVEVDGSDSPGKESFFSRIGKAAWSAFAGEGDADGPDDAAGAETQTQPDTAKEGRTLSRANRESAMAAIDANLDLLEDAGVDHGMERFTDREAYAFDLSEHSARTWASGDDGTDDEPDDDEDDDTETESMTDTNDDDGDGSSKSGDGDGGDPFDDAPAWAKSLKDDIEENSQQIKEVADGGDDGGEEEKDAFDDAPEWAKALAQQVEANAEAVESIGKQAGFSQQVQGGADANGDGGDDADKSLAGVLRSAGVQ